MRRILSHAVRVHSRGPLLRATHDVPFTIKTSPVPLKTPVARPQTPDYGGLRYLYETYGQYAHRENNDRLVEQLIRLCHLRLEYAALLGKTSLTLPLDQLLPSVYPFGGVSHIPEKTAHSVGLHLALWFGHDHVSLTKVDHSGYGSPLFHVHVDWKSPEMPRHKTLPNE